MTMRIPGAVRQPGWLRDKSLPALIVFITVGSK
jgi:hypothetical protein